MKTYCWVVVYTVHDFQHFVTPRRAECSPLWVLFPLKETKQNEKRDLSFLWLLVDKKVRKCLGLVFHLLSLASKSSTVCDSEYQLFLLLSVHGLI